MVRPAGIEPATTGLEGKTTHHTRQLNATQATGRKSLNILWILNEVGFQEKPLSAFASYATVSQNRGFRTDV